MDGDRRSFAFFAVGALVVLAAVFVIGLQTGRYIEKNSGAHDAVAGKTAPPPDGRAATPEAGDIRRDLGSFSEEAAKVPVVPPPPPMTMSEMEKSLTFRETLAKKEATTVPLVQPAKKGGAAAPGAGAHRAAAAARYQVQAGAFREQGAAESQRKKLEKAGFPSRVVKTSRKNRESVFRVLVGPYSDAEAARKAVRRLKSDLKIDALMIKG
jgi:DedD protein